MADISTCESCGSSLFATELAPLSVPCASCGHAQDFSNLPRVPEPRYEDVGLNLFAALRQWSDIARETTHSPDRIILGPCGNCKDLLTLPENEPVQITCKSCGDLQNRSAGDHIMDLLPTGSLEMQAGIPGNWFQLTWTPDVRIAEQEAPGDCPSCGAPVPPFIGESSCPHCSSTLVAWTRCGKRFLPGMQVKGTINGKRIDKWMLVSEALALYEEKSQVLKKGVKMLAGAMVGSWSAMLGVFITLALIGAGIFVFTLVVVVLFALWNSGGAP